MEKSSTSQQIPVSQPEKRILETFRVEFFPEIQKLKDVLIRIQGCKLYMRLYSPQLPTLEQEYLNTVSKLFLIDRKLTTLDVLFEGLTNTAENMQAYFKYQVMIKEKLSEMSSYIEIIDRTLDRKKQTLQNNRTLVIAVVALIVGLFQLV
jgi:hypothetical protein